MSESLQDRTEEATPKRRRDAAEKGEVPRSQELTTAALLAGSALVLNLTLPRVGHGLVELYGTLTLGSATAAQDASQLVPMLRSAGRGTLLLTMPLLASLAVVSATIATASSAVKLVGRRK